MIVGFIGSGKVGFSLGKYFSTKGINLSGYYSEFLKDAEEAANFTSSKAYNNVQDLINHSNIIFITTPDDIISKVWQTICNYDLKDKIICHCSGSMSSNIFSNINNSGAFGYSIHPIYAFSDKFNSYKNLTNAFFSIEGDPQHLNTMKTFIQSLGNNAFIVKSNDKALYHLSNVMVSNLVLSLLNTGCNYLTKCGIDDKDALNALLPLIENNLENIKTFGFTKALTGPIERNDLGTIKHHISVIPKNDVNVYKRLSINLTNLSEKKNPTKNYKQIKEYLGGL